MTKYLLNLNMKLNYQIIITTFSLQTFLWTPSTLLRTPVCPETSLKTTLLPTKAQHTANGLIKSPLLIKKYINLKLNKVNKSTILSTSLLDRQHNRFCGFKLKNDKTFTSFWKGTPHTSLFREPQPCCGCLNQINTVFSSKTHSGSKRRMRRSPHTDVIRCSLEIHSPVTVRPSSYCDSPWQLREIQLSHRQKW